MPRISGVTKYSAFRRDVNHERYAFPQFKAIGGPKPDPCAWVGLFLGKNVKGRMREDIKNADKKNSVEAYDSLRNALVDVPAELSVLELMRNILRYFI